MTVKFSDALAAAGEKSSAIQASIDALVSEKAAIDQLIAEAGSVSQASVDLFDKLTSELSVTTTVGDQ